MVETNQSEFTKLNDLLAGNGTEVLSPKLKASLGSMLGAFLGDSVGSFLEF